VDSTIVCERPHLASFIEHMQRVLFNAGLHGVNIKAKSNEGMGFVGRDEGIAAYAVCLLEKNHG
jgi:2-C-methyl-D-erythritol 2,4-cyclodiphosphate synthase